MSVELGKRKRVVYNVWLYKDEQLRPVFKKDLVVLPKPRKRRVK